MTPGDGGFLWFLCRSRTFDVRRASEELIGDIGETGRLSDAPDPVAEYSAGWPFSTSCSWAQVKFAGLGARTVVAAFPTTGSFLFAGLIGSASGEGTCDGNERGTGG